MGFLGRYLSGLCVAALGLCAAGWLVLTPVAFDYRGLPNSDWHRAALADRATGGGVALVSALTLAAWAVAWRRKLRADGVLLAGVSRKQARREARELRWREREVEAGNDQANGAPDPAQVLSELRTLLLPLLAENADAPSAASPHEGIPEPRSEQEPAGMPGEPAGMPGGFYPAPIFAPGFASVPLDPPAAPAPSGLAAIESMLAGAELAMAGSGEEETW